MKLIHKGVAVDLETLQEEVGEFTGIDLEFVVAMLRHAEVVPVGEVEIDCVEEEDDTRVFASMYFDAVYYSPIRKQLEVFSGFGGAYAYAGVPTDVFEAFQAASADNRSWIYWNENIEGKYNERRIL